MNIITLIVTSFWFLSLLAFGVMAVWSMWSDPAADGQWDERQQRDGVGAGSGAHETASTPHSASPAGVHATAQE